MLLIYFIVLIVLLIVSLSYREGFETGTYAYLAPSSPALLDASTQSKFMKAYNESGGLLNKFITNENIGSLTSDITLEEVNYYIQQNKWPYGSYIMNYLTVNKEDLLKSKSKLNSLEDIQKVFPTRLIYKYGTKYTNRTDNISLYCDMEKTCSSTTVERTNMASATKIEAPCSFAYSLNT